MKLPDIVVSSRQTRDISNDAWNALIESNDPVTLMREGSDMVDVIQGEGMRPVIRRLGEKTLASRLARVADWVAVHVVTDADGHKKKSRTAVQVPKVLPSDILAAYSPYNDLPRLEGISPCPLMRPDGTIIQDAGYDAQTGWYLSGQVGWRLADLTGPQCAQRLHTELFGDFPFADDASLAGAYALLLLPFLRAGIQGPTPLHLFDAPMQGTGKSLLAEVCLSVGLPSVHVQPIPEKEEELQKTILSELLAGAECIVFDNIRSHLATASLESALTSTHYTTRVLGVTKMGRAPNRAAWAATSNNATLSPDLVRRTLYISLDAERENPSERAGFRHPRIKEWIADNRDVLTGYALGMIAHWREKGMPLADIRMGSFEEWGGIVGGILEVCEIHGLASNRNVLRERADSESDMWRTAFSGWWETFTNAPVTVKELLERLDDNEGVTYLAGDGSEKSKQVRLGKALLKRERAVIGGFRCEQMSRTNAGRRFKLTSSSVISDICVISAPDSVCARSGEQSRERAVGLVTDGTPVTPPLDLNGYYDQVNEIDRDLSGPSSSASGGGR